MRCKSKTPPIKTYDQVFWLFACSDYSPFGGEAVNTMFSATSNILVGAVALAHTLMSYVRSTLLCNLSAAWCDQYISYQRVTRHAVYSTSIGVRHLQHCIGNDSRHDRSTLRKNIELQRIYVYIIIWQCLLTGDIQWALFLSIVFLWN